MAKFCYNCGSELREGAAFCTKCGKVTEPSKEDINTVKRSENLKGNTARANKNYIKYLIGAVAGVGVIVFIIILSNINTSRNSGVNEEKNASDMTDSSSLSVEEISVSAKYELIGKNCSEFVSEYEKNGGSVLNGLDATRVSIGKSEYERRAEWEDWLKGFEYNLANDCQIYMLQNSDKDDYASILLFAENDIITSYYVLWSWTKIDVNMAQYINETEFAEIKGLDVKPTISNMIGTDKNGNKWDNSSECRPVFQTDKYTVQFQAEKFDPKTGDALTDWEKMWFVGFYVSLDSDIAVNVEDHDSNIAAAGEMFELFLCGQDEATYDDVSCSGSIIVCRETPEEYNNYASYSICGRGFSPIYDTDCIGADEYSWIFKSGGYYYLICPGMDGYYIYYDSSKEKLSQSSECCGIFSLYVSDESVNGENDINIANFEQKVSLSPGNREATDSIMEAYIKEIQESDDPYFFTYEYLGECSDGFYYYNGETNTFNVYRITFEGGYESIYFIPINVEENMIYEFYEYYYELMYRWTQY